MFSVGKSLLIAALLSIALPSVTASPTPSLDILNPKRILGVDSSIPFWQCYEERILLITLPVCTCVPYYGKIGGKRDVGEVVRSSAGDKRILLSGNKCIVPAKNRPDLIKLRGGCCEQACVAWCGKTCLMKGEVCVSGKPQKPAVKRHRNGIQPGLFSRDGTCNPGTEKCFVGGTAKSPIYECVKTSNDLEHCGGCATADPFAIGSTNESTAQDCTAISNVASVGCIAGRCAVQSCEPGYVVITDVSGDRCVPSQAEVAKLRKYRLE